MHIQAVLAPGCPLPPDVGQQPAARDNLICVQQKNRQERALLGAAQGKLLAVPADLQRPKNPKLHVPPRPAMTLTRCAYALGEPRERFC
jgi:hypothetical protein